MLLTPCITANWVVDIPRSIDTEIIMKATILTTSLAAISFSVLPMHADDAPKKPAVEQAATQTATVYIVQVSGKG